MTAAKYTRVDIDHRSARLRIATPSLLETDRAELARDLGRLLEKWGKRIARRLAARDRSERRSTP